MLCCVSALLRVMWCQGLNLRITLEPEMLFINVTIFLVLFVKNNNRNIKAILPNFPSKSPWIKKPKYSDQKLGRNLFGHLFQFVTKRYQNSFGAPGWLFFQWITYELQLGILVILHTLWPWSCLKPFTARCQECASHFSAHFLCSYQTIKILHISLQCLCQCKNKNMTRVNKVLTLINS